MVRLNCCLPSKTVRVTTWRISRIWAHDLWVFLVEALAAGSRSFLLSHVGGSENALAQWWHVDALGVGQCCGLLGLLTLDIVDQFSGGAIKAVLPVEGARTLATSWKLDVLAQRPWSVVTRMFTHQGVWHLGMNMLLLFWMGRVYHGEVGSRRLLSTYLGGGWQGFWPISL